MLISIQTDTGVNATNPVCDSAYWNNIAGTLEYLRLRDVCQVEM